MKSRCKDFVPFGGPGPARSWSSTPPTCHRPLHPDGSLRDRLGPWTTNEAVSAPFRRNWGAEPAAYGSTAHEGPTVYCLAFGPCTQVDTVSFSVAAVGVEDPAGYVCVLGPPLIAVFNPGRDPLRGSPPPGRKCRRRRALRGRGLRHRRPKKLLRLSSFRTHPFEFFLGLGICVSSLSSNR